MRFHIRQAKKAIKGSGYIGVNVLFAMNDFAEKMKAALEEKVDFIIQVQEFRGICMHGEERQEFQFFNCFSAKLAKISED